MSLAHTLPTRSVHRRYVITSKRTPGPLPAAPYTQRVSSGVHSCPSHLLPPLQLRYIPTAATDQQSPGPSTEHGSDQIGSDQCRPDTGFPVCCEPSGSYQATGTEWQHPTICATATGHAADQSDSVNHTSTGLHEVLHWCRYPTAARETTSGNLHQRAKWGNRQAQTTRTPPCA